MKKTTHKLVNYATSAVKYIQVTFDEWMDLIWSDGASTHWMITYDGCDYYDFGIVRAKSHQHPGNYPMASYAVGVGADEVQDAMKVDRKGGVPTRYTKEGDPIFTSRGHRRKYLKLHKFHDRNSYNGE